LSLLSVAFLAQETLNTFVVIHGMFSRSLTG